MDARWLRQLRLWVGRVSSGLPRTEGGQWRSSLTRDGKAASLTLDLLNAAASKAGSFLDEAEAVKSQEAEKPTELRHVYAFRLTLRRP